MSLAVNRRGPRRVELAQNLGDRAHPFEHARAAVAAREVYVHETARDGVEVTHHVVGHEACRELLAAQLERRRAVAHRRAPSDAASSTRATSRARSTGSPFPSASEAARAASY